MNWAVAELEVSYKPKIITGVSVSCSNDAYNVFKQMWDKSLINIQEQFCAIFLDQKNEVIAFRLISTGKMDATTVDIPLLLSLSLKCRAKSIIIAHNHPSENLNVSDSDIEVTDKIFYSCKIIDLSLIDHLIITNKGFFSFVDQDLFKF